MRPSPNLLPKKLLIRRSRRVRARKWVGVLILEILAGVLVGMVSRYDYANPAVEARDSIQSTVGQIDVVTTALASLQRELQSLEQKLAVASEVSGQPDWSIVLAAIAWRGKALIELNSTQLMSAPAKGGGPGNAFYKVSLLGTSETRSDVTQFVELLEDSGIFEDVRISQTQTIPDPTPEDDKHKRVGFTIEASLAEGAQP